MLIHGIGSGRNRRRSVLLVCLSFATVLCCGVALAQQNDVIQLAEVPSQGLRVPASTGAAEFYGSLLNSVAVANASAGSNETTTGRKEVIPEEEEPSPDAIVLPGTWMDTAESKPSKQHAQRLARKDNLQAGIDTKIVKNPLDFLYKDNAQKNGMADSACDRSGRIIMAPYLQSGASNRMIIRWRTEGQGKGVVCYGSDPEAMTEVLTEDGLQWPKYVSRKDVESWDTLEVAEHYIEVTGLDPNTQYYYTVATTGPKAMADSDRLVPVPKYYSFTTFPEPKSKVDTPIRVWAIGDSGWGDHKAVRVRDAFANFTGGDWDLSLGLGDLAYLRGKDWEYQKRFFNYLTEQNARVPMFTTPGNHDAFTCDMDAQTGPYFELFSNPGDGKSGGLASNHKSYYSFDYGPIHFVSVDSHHLGLHDDPDLYAWLEKDLAAAQEANYDWIIAYQHQPPYSKGSHDSDEQYECYKLRTNLVPMYEKYGVDLVLAGHSHSYERSHLLHGHLGSSSEVNSNPAVIKKRWAKSSEGIDTLEKDSCGPNSGTMYIVTGGGAIRGGGPLNHPAMAYTAKNRGSMLLQFEQNELRMWLLGEHRDEKDDYAGFTKILDEAVFKKSPKCSRT